MIALSAPGLEILRTLWLWLDCSFRIIGSQAVIIQSLFSFLAAHLHLSRTLKNVISAKPTEWNGAWLTGLSWPPDLPHINQLVHLAGVLLYEPVPATLSEVNTSPAWMVLAVLKTSNCIWDLTIALCLTVLPSTPSQWQTPRQDGRHPRERYRQSRTRDVRPLLVEIKKEILWLNIA